MYKNYDCCRPVENNNVHFPFSSFENYVDACVEGLACADGVRVVSAHLLKPRPL